MSLYNPAFSGVDPYTDVKLAYRYQWAGIEGAPKSINLSFTTRTKQPLELVYNTPRYSNINALNVPKKKLMMHGLGVNLFNTSYGQVKSVGAGINYSVHFALSKKLRTAIGLSAIVNNTKVNVNDVILRDGVNDAYYTSLVANGSTETELNVRAGVLVYSRNFYAGISYLPLFQTALQSTDVALSKPFYRGSAQVGLSFPVSPSFDVKPSVIALLDIQNTLTLDCTVKGYFQDRVWVGFSYRTIQSGVLLAGLNVNQIFAFAYSYEMSLGKFKQYHDGSHELVLSIKLNNFKKQDPYTW